MWFWVEGGYWGLWMKGIGLTESSIGGKFGHLQRILEGSKGGIGVGMGVGDNGGMLVEGMGDDHIEVDYN